jgi:hypothetical protein
MKFNNNNNSRLFIGRNQVQVHNMCVQISSVHIIYSNFTFTEYVYSYD